MTAILPIFFNPDDEDWKLDGLCAQVDPELWFPDKGGSVKEPKRICGMCPVREECLEYSLKWEQRFGIWAGLSERERRPLLRARKAAS